MKFWVGVTDNAWFNHLAGQALDEVNFWQPSATPPFRGAPMGMPFLFKLKRPHNHVAGMGFFVAYSKLPISLAWEIFGEKNGAGSLDDFRSMLEPLTGSRNLQTEIGCTVLANVQYLPREQWIAEPSGWAASIVRGKMYESEAADGASLWAAMQQRLSLPSVQEPGDKFGKPVLVNPRLGQSSFRVLVTDAYKRRCALTGENTLVALEAAHIVPYSQQGGTHDVRNGLLLRADFHRLFDVGLVSVTEDLKIKVSPKIHEAWFNGKAYYRLNDQPLSVLPDLPEHRPDPDRLGWHYRNCFQA
ncbi:MAG TPA: HNH endonuclease [Rhodanobacteraceae bacterium]